MTDDVYDTRAQIMIFPSLSLGKYDILVTRVVSIAVMAANVISSIKVEL